MSRGISMSDRTAVVLLSGGLDSVTVLAQTLADGYRCLTLSFDYGQRHRAELNAAQAIADHYAVAHHVIRLDLGWIGGSALTDTALAVPEAPTEGIPITYVPARNTLFLSYALAYAEVSQASAIFVGVNAVDYSGYPDCRPDYIAAFQAMADQATRAGIEGQGPVIEAPLIAMSKADIIRRGSQLGVDYAMTVSCYQANEAGEACGRCDSCRLRQAGFAEAGVVDPTRYQ